MSLSETSRALAIALCDSKGYIKFTDCHPAIKRMMMDQADLIQESLYQQGFKVITNDSSQMELDQKTF